MKQAPLIVVQLIHLLGPLKGEIQEFSEAVILVGRHPDSQVRFPADLAVVSRKHAEITREGNRFKLVDLSTNGTFVNGKRVKEVFLKNGDVLTFSEAGPKVSFLMDVKEDQQEVEAPPSPRPELQRPRIAEERPPVAQPEIQRSEAPAVQTVNVPLVIQYGPTLRSFKQLPVTIGKHPNCQFTMDHPAILDLHAQIFFAQTQYWVKDLTGKDVIRVNGQPVSIKGSPIGTNDLLSLSPQGPVFRFLGEGRLAEVEESPAGISPESSREGEEKDHERLHQEGTDREHKSLFKRFFN